MKYGDYRMEVNGKVIVIERKTPTDFIGSTQATVRDPATKLARQLNGCLTEAGATQVVLLIDGLYWGLKGGNLKAGKMKLRHELSAFASKLRTVMGHGVRVEHNPSDWYLPQFLLAMYHYEERNEHTTMATTPRSFAVPSKEAAKWTVLLGIKGVGPKLAQLLLNHYGSVKNISLTTADDLKKFKGVGQVTAENILWHLT